MPKSKADNSIRSSAAEYLTFAASTGESNASFEMRYEDENIWLTQKMMAALYDVSVAAINQHLKKVFEDGELRQEAVIKKCLITASDGKRYNMNHYNLQAIIAVGFKVNNQRAVQFRKWAGQIVKDYTIQGWTMDHQSIPGMNPGKNDIRRGAPWCARTSPEEKRAPAALRLCLAGVVFCHDMHMRAGNAVCGH